MQNTAAETRTLSFLVCRIRGFDDLVTAYVAQPEALCRFVRRSATLMADTIHAHGGIIDRVSPGGLSAYFEAGPETGLHTLKACECALAMLARAETLNRKLMSTHPLRIGIGINTGSAILGDFGTDDQPLQAAVGRAAERADALERLSTTYGAAILAGAAVEKDAERSFAFLQVDHCTEDHDGNLLPVWAMLAPPMSRASPQLLALKSFHTHIFDAIRDKDWNGARAAVAHCRALSGANPVLYDFYLQRIDHYEANPPASDWNGVLMPMRS
ncbi:MAG TPA: adenylate/guanylate cyclase domain-containing protein [Micropepsaceae bacterium]|nr:adenylate/guanylate cyclase domain-containing protein [Micropepsaceae bacterium]